MRWFKKRVSIRRFGTTDSTGNKPFWIVYQTKQGVKELCESPSGESWDELKRRIMNITHRPIVRMSPGARRRPTDTIGQIPTGKYVTVEDVENILTDWQLIDSIHGAGAFERVINMEELAVLMMAREVAVVGA